MALDRLPAEEHLDLLIPFARASQGIASYEEVARSHDLKIIKEDWNPDFRLFKCKDFALMFCGEDDDDDRYSRIARLHCVSLLEEQDEFDLDLGIITVSTMPDLRQAFQRLYQKLNEKLGPPTQEGTWIAEWDMGLYLDDDPTEEEFAYACWQMPDAILVLLLNREGDMHNGEYATVDLRIGPLDRQAGLPHSISDPWQM